MVLSASSVYSFEQHDGDSYAIVKRQLMWVRDRRCPCAWVAQPAAATGAIRRLAWPGYRRLAGAAAADRRASASSVNGNTNWLALGPFADPALRDRQARARSCGPPTSTPTRSAGSAACTRCMVPVVPGMLAGHRRWSSSASDLGTALVLFAILLGMLWVVGAPGPALRARASRWSASSAFCLATTSAERLERLTNFVDPFKDYHDAGWQPAHGLYALSTRRLVRPGHRRQPAEVGRPARGAHRLHLRRARRGARPGRHAAGDRRCSSPSPTPRSGSPRSTADPFVRYMSFGIVVWLLGQMIINVGMVLALLPVIGIPLPLVSYGGSALLPSLVALGLLVGFARREPEAAARPGASAGGRARPGCPPAGSRRAAAL